MRVLLAAALRYVCTHTHVSIPVLTFTDLRTACTCAHMPMLHLATPVCNRAQVREAMAALLAAVQRTRAIHFYDVVPLEDLLAVMACDAPSVSHKIQQVLVPTYFPNPEEGSVGGSIDADTCVLLPRLKTSSAAAAAAAAAVRAT